jgi:hypothetical protein
MSTHQFKVGDKVTVNGIAGTIFTLGHAEDKGRKFHTCTHGKEIAEHLIGYQVNFGNKIKIIKESDIISA